VPTSLNTDGAHKAPRRLREERCFTADGVCGRQPFPTPPLSVGGRGKMVWLRPDQLAAGHRDETAHVALDAGPEAAGATLKAPLRARAAALEADELGG
jgi:hypothetical protein